MDMSTTAATTTSTPNNSNGVGAGGDVLASSSSASPTQSTSSSSSLASTSLSPTGPGTTTIVSPTVTLTPSTSTSATVTATSSPNNNHHPSPNASVTSSLSNSTTMMNRNSSNGSLSSLASSSSIRSGSNGNHFNSSPPNSLAGSNNLQSLDPEHIIISYQDDFGVWKYVEPDLWGHLPLKSIEWKTKTGHTKRVDRMPVEILQHDNEKLRQSFEFQDLYRKPYLYLYFVHCDDADAYKNTVKSKIKHWVNSMTDRSQEWLIVYVSLGQKKSFSELTSKLHRTVYDKIKSDFNVKRDRCCQLRFFDDSNKCDDLWNDFLLKMKEGIISSAEQYLTTYEEEIRKSDAKRTSPGWNYLSFFFLKESLALIYERAHLYEDALLQYYELEVLFAENKGQFEKVTANDINDGINILDCNKKQYRELIYHNKISLFDFKHYLFAREAKLLFLLQRPAEVASRSIPFITSIQHIITKNPKNFTPHFKESWVFSASIEIIKACQDSFEKINSVHTPNQGGASVDHSNNNSTTNSQSVINNQKVKPPTPPLSRFLGALGNVGNNLGLGQTPTSLNSSSSSITSPAGSIGSNTTTSVQTSKESTPTAGSKSILSGFGFSGSQSLTTTQSSHLQASVSNWSRTSLSSLSDLDIKTQEKQEKETFEYTIGDLLFNAAQKLEELAIKLKMLPADQFGVFHKNTDLMFIDEHNLKPLPTTTLFAYPPLQVAFQSIKEFKQLYLEIMNQAERLFTQTHRTRSLSRLNYSIANFHFKLKEFQNTETLLKSIVNIYTRESWTLLEYAIKTKLSYSQKKLNHIVDYVATCVSLLSYGLLNDNEEKDYYLNEITQLSKSPDLKIIQSMTSFLKCKVGNIEREYKFLDTIPITVKIKSYQSQPITLTSGEINFVKVNNPSEKLVFRLNEFTVKPGDNTFTFTTSANIKSTFVKDSLWLKMGCISFGKSLKSDEKKETRIVETASAITLESFTTSPLFMCCVQYIGIKLNTHTDSIEKGVLSFKSLTGVTIIQPPFYNAILRSRSNNAITPLQLHLQNEKIHLKNIDFGDQLEFYLPVMAINQDPCSHQIQIDLQHQKQTKETFSSSLISTTLFINPFAAQVSIIPLQNKLFLKLLLQCNAPNSIQLFDYSLEDCDQQFIEQESDRKYPYYLIKDYNQSLKNNTLYPAHNISFMFEINKYNINETITNNELKLNIQYINKLQDLDPNILLCKPLWKDHCEYSIPISIDLPMMLYEIDLCLPKVSYIGSIVTLEITISNLEKSGESITKDLQYSIEYDFSSWTLSGRCKQSFKLQNGKSQSFSIDLIPICGGSLPLPTVNLNGIEPTKIKYSKKFNDHIYVYPPNHLTSSATPNNRCTIPNCC